jgi:dihydroorotate dehydrogenase (NAD+) catalytic subunit
MAHQMDLSARVGSLTLKNPLILASGPLTRRGNGILRYARAGCSAIVTKTTLPEPWQGNPSPRIMQVRNFEVINCEGVPNIGLKATLEEVRKVKDQMNGSLLLVNIAALTIEEYVEEAVKFEKAGADAIEITPAGCPNYRPVTKTGAGFFGGDPKQLVELIRAVKGAIKIPVWIKVFLSSAPFETIKAVGEGKPDAIVVRNLGVRCMPIDIDTGKPILGHPHGIGGLTGPYLRDVGLRDVANTARLIDIPIIGNGGVYTGEDVIMFIMAGASAVQILTCLMRKGPIIVEKICNEIEQYMIAKGLRNLEDIRGLTLKYLPPEPAL